MACYELMTRGNRQFDMTSQVRHLRDQRMQAVQNDQQYAFIHRIVLEILLKEGYIAVSGDYNKFVKEYDELMARKKKELAKFKAARLNKWKRRDNCKFR